MEYFSHEEEVEKLRQIFLFYDSNGDGLIQEEELKNIYAQINLEITQEELN